MAEILLGNVKGPAGAQGAGVPLGGATGQVLAKKSNTNNDTQWVTPSGEGADLSTPWQTTGNIMNDDGGNELYLTYRLNKAGLAEVFMSLNPQSTSNYVNCNWPRLISLSEGFSAMSQVMGAWSSDTTCVISWGGISAGDVNPYFDYFVSDPADTFMTYLCYQPS